MYTRLSKKRAVSLQGEAPLTEERTRREIAWCAGMEGEQRRDPLRHVTESFSETFERVGRQRAAAMAAESGSGFSEEDRREEGVRNSAEQRRRSRQREDGGKERSGGGQEGPFSPIVRFSETAFQRGTLSAAVIAGTGKMMLISCLKRAAGQRSPRRIQEQQVLGVGSQTRNVPGHDPDQMIFNRGFTNSAIGLVVDTLRDARRAVDTMTRMAEGIGELGEEEGGTLRSMYPFLDSSREAALLTQYRERLAESADARERAVLQNAIVKLEALRVKKAQMKNEFINKLRSVSDRATETLADLERPGAGEEIFAAFSETAFDADADGNAGDAQEGADAPDEAENRFEPTDGPGPGWDPDGADEI